MYKAHINHIKKEIQTIKEHSENTALLCKEISIPELKDIMYTIGLLHDIGKYQKSFQERIDGKNIKVEHSTCGAIVANEKYKNAVALIMMYCIMGHHSGIPDGGYKNDTSDMPTLFGRLKRNFEDYDQYLKELKIPDINEEEFIKFLAQDCNNDKKIAVDKFAFITRYCFSCLVDADTIDTAQFINNIDKRSMNADFEKCLALINKRLESFVCKTNLQKYRSKLQNQVYENINKKAHIYIMNMPTGSGKTLCSMKFALEKAIKENKKRIIYVIPYNSIIEQTAEIFESIFGEYGEILRHQSTFTYEDYNVKNEDYKEVIKFATENWDAQIIITTTVQFFESIYSNKRSKLRKLHNMSDSIIIFDEVHTMPENYLQPCLESISYITKYLNSEAVFLTATMPNFKELIEKYALKSINITNLINDKSLFQYFKKCNYKNIGVLSGENIIEKSYNYPTSLIIVNKRKTARELYNMCQGKKYHLSTYMTGFDRNRVINEIKYEIKKLEEEYPNFENVPNERKITVISTSLIEAGVDMDFYAVFRELSGVDNILQAGGRCNREGKRNLGDVFIFEMDTYKTKTSKDIRPEITRGLLKKYTDISVSESIDEYYEKLFFIKRDNITKNSMYQYSKELSSLPFREYSENFEIIDNKTISIVVSCNDESEKLIEDIIKTGYGNNRKLQKYACSVYKDEFDILLKQNVIDDFGSGIYCLTNIDYYNKETGIQFEGIDYFI